MFAQTIQNNFLCFGKVAVAAQKLSWDDYWIRVNGFWIEITKKVGQPDYFLIPLQLTRFEGASKETEIQNSIVLETTPLTGSLKIYLSTTNRLDILQLYQAISTGQRIISTAFERRQIERMVSHNVEVASGFLGLGKEKLSFRMTGQGIDITGGKAPVHYDFDKIKSVTTKQNDPNCHTQIHITVEENGQLVTKDYNCPEHSAVLNTVSCFLMNAYLKVQQPN